jgi:hypothetical protein
MSNFLIDEDTDLLAAEFVLGTLDTQERTNAQSLLRTDHGFIAMVRIWERRFGELHLMVEPVEPDAKILQRIKAKIAEISGERAPVGQPPTEVTPSPEPQAAAIGLPAEAELPKPADAPAAGEAPAPQDVVATGTTPQPEVSAIAEVVKPAESPPGPAAPVPPTTLPPTTLPPAGNLSAPPVATPTEVPAAAEIPAVAEVPAASEAQPGPESGPSEPAAKLEGAEIATPPPQPSPSLKLPDAPSDKLQDQRAARRSEINYVVRSRGRWRMFGVCMTLLVMGLAALLAAWRFVPDRLPPGLRAAEVMKRVGIEASPDPASAVKRAPPVSQFDE